LGLKFTSYVLLAALIVSTFGLAFIVPPAKAQSGTIYINPDGSISSPVPANITTSDNITYTFTGNNYLPIVVNRSNIIINGRGYMLHASQGTGFSLTGMSNVTIKNTTITNSNIGIYLNSSSGNILSSNKVTRNRQSGIELDYSSYNNTVSGNDVTSNIEVGIWLSSSSGNVLSGNDVTSNIEVGIWLSSSSGNTLSGNTSHQTAGALGSVLLTIHRVQ
jgi:parallel beta-helix repeat protein